MAELIQLDAAAKLVGKSEVTLRRLVKSGKVKAHKEKTLTGFIYRVDSAEVLSYYNLREEAVAGAIASTQQVETPEQPKATVASVESVPGHGEEHKPAHTGHAIPSNGKMRLAVANETGNSAEYWLKRAEVYEEKYHHELQKVSQMREELGVWRGRAEHAQAMLMKMLPAAGNPIEVPAGTPAKQSKKESSSWAVVYITAVSVIFVLTAIALGYIFLSK